MDPVRGVVCDSIVMCKKFYACLSIFYAWVFLEDFFKDFLCEIEESGSNFLFEFF